MTESIIEIRDFSFRIKKKEILKRISIEVKKGEYLSVVGPNGAGKTTLLKCLNRILKGGEGVIRIKGRDLNAYSQRDLARRIAYVPQANGRGFPFTVYEFALMARYPFLSPFASANAEDERAVSEALSLTGMEAFSDRFLGTLSGGERQKVFIAAALAQETEILLLDEPATFLDPRHQEEIFRILRRVNRESGTTILSVTHNINGAVLSGERIVALKEGEVVCCLSGPEFMNNEILRAVYGKAFLFIEHPETGERMVVPEGAS